jgi:hypothetical protein
VHKAPDLRRFSTPFASFKCDKQTGHSLADKPANQETQLRRKEIEELPVSAPVEATIRVKNQRWKRSNIADRDLEK